MSHPLVLKPFGHRSTPCIKIPQEHAIRKDLIIILFHLQQQLPTNTVYSKPPKCPQNTSLSHLRGLVDLSHHHTTGGNVITTKAEICATPPQNRRRFFIPKHLRSPFGIYKNRNNNGGTPVDQNYTFSGKRLDNDIIIQISLIYINFIEILRSPQKPFSIKISPALHRQ